MIEITWDGLRIEIFKNCPLINMAHYYNYYFYSAPLGGMMAALGVLYHPGKWRSPAGLLILFHSSSSFES